MNSDQVESFNKQSFPYKIEIIGKFLYLKKYELDDLIQEDSDTTEIDLCQCKMSTILFIKSDYINSIFIKNNTIYLNEDV
jgi:hypothetical protein